MAVIYMPENKNNWAGSLGQGLGGGFSNALQMAMLKKFEQDMAVKQQQKNIEQAQKMFPEAFTQSLNPAGKSKYNMDIVSPGMREEALGQVMPSIPQQYKQTAFNPQAAQKYPGLGMNFRTGEMEYKVPTPDIFTQIANYNNAKAAGLIPEGMDITGVSGKNVQIGTDIPKKKFEAEQSEKQTQLQKESQFILDQTQSSLDTIEEVEKGINYFGAGSLIRAIPTLQPEKTKWQSNVDKLLAGKIVDLMTQMKATSKTGATGFGQLNREELKVLKDASTALKKTLSPEDAQKYLTIMKENLQKVIQNKGGQVQSQGQPDLSIEALIAEKQRRMGR